MAIVRWLGLSEERLLEWSFEDGWELHYKFLGREIPDIPFPNGNPPKAWAERIAKTTADYHAKAIRNMVLFGAVIGGIGGVGGQGLDLLWFQSTDWD